MKLSVPAALPSSTFMKIIASLIFIILMTDCVSGQKRRPKPPLIEDTPSFKLPTRSTHCNFGNQSFEVEDKWKPNLGPPNNVLVCVICECVSVNRKSRVLTRVKCRDIKNDCPKPSCEEPELLPGRCCKTCPGDEEENIETDLRGTKISRKGEEGKQIYALVGKPKSQPRPSVDHPVSETRLQNIGANTNVMDDQEDNRVESTHKCYYEGEIFEDGSQWQAQHHECQMCMCQGGRIKCHDIICPALSCVNPITVKGECCPVCPGDVTSLNETISQNNECYFEGDRKKHLAGTKWHPYLPPFGFDLCSLCTCLPGSLEIQCRRSVTCPPLTCEEHEAFRENPSDCCKRCPAVVPVKAFDSPDQQGDQRVASSFFEKGPNELLAAGGCKFKGRVFANGDEWHPTITSYGKVNCVSCHCKDGSIKFRRTKCAKLSCLKTIIPDGECCPRCA